MFVWLFSLTLQPPQPYKFAYEVKDAKTNNDFGQSESSDGKVVTGNYYVQLPDGRMEVVNYKADGYGYNADVQYKGEAKYPEYKGEAKYPEYKASPYAPVAYKAPAPAPYAEPAPAPYVSAKYWR